MINFHDIKKYEPIWGVWKVEEVLGKGASGIVYKTSRVLGNEKLFSAVKFITIEHNTVARQIGIDSSDKETIENYFISLIQDIEKEIKILHKLKGNSNIVSYEDYMVVEHHNSMGWDILIRMELVQSLHEYINSNTMTIEDVLNVGIDISKALELCYKQNIIHRDIKEANIFVSANGDYKLGDFGIAKEINPESMTMTQAGTPIYIAPEIYKGSDYDFKVDIYTLSLVLYKLLNTMRFPFFPQFPNEIKPSDHEQALNLRLKGEKLIKPLNSTDSLWVILEKALSYNPNDRYQNITEFRQELERIKLDMSNDIKSTIILQPTKKINPISNSNENLIDHNSNSNEKETMPIDKNSQYVNNQLDPTLSATMSDNGIKKHIVANGRSNNLHNNNQNSNIQNNSNSQNSNNYSQNNNNGFNPYINNNNTNNNFDQNKNSSIFAFSVFTIISITIISIILLNWSWIKSLSSPNTNDIEISNVNLVQTETSSIVEEETNTPKKTRTNTPEPTDTDTPTTTIKTTKTPSPTPIKTTAKLSIKPFTISPSFSLLASAYNIKYTVSTFKSITSNYTGVNGSTAGEIDMQGINYLTGIDIDYSYNNASVKYSIKDADSGLWKEGNNYLSVSKMSGLKVCFNNGQSISNYHVVYRSYVKDYGWSGWSKDDEESPKVESQYKGILEAVEIKIEKD